MILESADRMRPDTITQQFYLSGEDVSTAQDVEVPSSIDEAELRHLIASHFAIVESKGELSVTNDRQDINANGASQVLVL